MFRYLFPRYLTKWTFINYILHFGVACLLVYGGTATLQIILFLGHLPQVAGLAFFFMALWLGSFVIVVREGFMAFGALVEDRPWIMHFYTCLCSFLICFMFTVLFILSLPPDLP